jgi:hypothetical protein
MKGIRVLVVLLPFGVEVCAQEWTPRDSAWLQRVLSGKEELHLNEATRKAIEAGTLISTDPNPAIQMRLSPLEIPFYKTVEGVTRPKTGQVKPQELPPPVYRLYGMEQKDSLPDISRSVKFYPKTVNELKNLDLLTPRKSTVNDPATLRSGAHGFSAEEVLQTIFRPSHRARKRNAKHANAWKTYNEGY